MRITVEIDDASLQQLEKLPEAERRTLARQAEVLLKRALSELSQQAERQDDATCSS